MEKLSSLNEKRREQLAPLKESTAYSKNKATLDKIGEDENGLTFNGKPVGGAAERPTDQYTIDFQNTMCGSSLEQASNTYQIGFVIEDDMTEEEKALIGKEIANIEFEIAPNKWISIKDMYAVDNNPYISLVNRIERNQTKDAYLGVIFAAVYYPISYGFLSNDSYSKMKITYYTD